MTEDNSTDTLQQMTPTEQHLAHSLPCTICLKEFNPEDLIKCNCDDFICGNCPAFACSCEYEGLMQQLVSELKPSAIELAQLRTIKELMGTDALTPSQHSRFTLLTDVVESLRNEINRLDEIEHGENYDDDHV